MPPCAETPVPSFSQCTNRIVRARPVSISALAIRSALVLEDPPEKTVALAPTLRSPSSSTRRHVVSSLLNWKLNTAVVGITKSISSLSMPASRIASRAASSAKLIAPWSGKRPVGTSPVPTIAVAPRLGFMRRGPGCRGGRAA